MKKALIYKGLLSLALALSFNTSLWAQPMTDEDEAFQQAAAASASASSSSASNASSFVTLFGENYRPDIERLTFEDMALNEKPGLMTELVRALPQFTNLTELDLSGKKIGSGGMGDLAKVLDKLPNLTELNLSYNILGLGVYHLAEVLGNLKNLKVLRLSVNFIDSEGMGDLAKVLGKLPNLTELNLSYNILGSEGMRHLVNVLGKLPNLRALDLSSNYLGSEGMRHLVNVLGNLTNLRELNIRNNHTDLDGMRLMVNALRNLKGLRVLELPNLRSEDGIQDQKAFENLFLTIFREEIPIQRFYIPRENITEKSREDFLVLALYNALMKENLINLNFGSQNDFFEICDNKCYIGTTLSQRRAEEIRRAMAAYYKDRQPLQTAMVGLFKTGNVLNQGLTNQWLNENRIWTRVRAFMDGTGPFGNATPNGMDLKLWKNIHRLLSQQDELNAAEDAGLLNSIAASSPSSASANSASSASSATSSSSPASSTESMMRAAASREGEVEGAPSSSAASSASDTVEKVQSHRVMSQIQAQQVVLQAFLLILKSNQSLSEF